MKRLKKPNVPEPVIKMEYSFYLANKTEGKFSMKLELIKKKYLAFLKEKDKMGVQKKGQTKMTWSQYYGNQTVVVFVTSKKGLNSTIEIEELNSLEAALKLVRQSLYK